MANDNSETLIECYSVSKTGGKHKLISTNTGNYKSETEHYTNNTKTLQTHPNTTHNMYIIHTEYMYRIHTEYVQNTYRIFTEYIQNIHRMHTE